MATFDTQSALKAGYSQGEIDSFLSKHVDLLPYEQRPGIKNLAKAGQFLGMGPFAQLVASPFIKNSPEYQAAQASAQAQQQGAQNIPEVTRARLQAQGKDLSAGMPAPESMNRDIALGGYSNKQIAGSALSTALLLAGGAVTKPLTGVASKAGSAVTNTVANTGRPVLGNILGRATTEAVKMAPLGAAQAGAVSAAEGKSNTDIGKNLLLGGVISGVLPFSVEGGKVLAKASGKGLANLLGIGTGQGGAVNQELANRAFKGDMGKVTEFRKFMSDPTEITDQAKEAVRVVREARNSAYQKELATLAGPESLDLTTARDQIKQKLLGDIRGKISPASAGTLAVGDDGLLAMSAPTKEQIKLGASKLAQGKSQQLVEDAYSLVNEWDDFTVGGVDALKQQLNDMASDAKPGSKAQQFVIESAQKVGDILDKNVSGYKEMTKSYAQMTQAIRQAETVLGLKKQKSLGDVNLATAFSRIINSMKPRKDIQYEALKKLSGLSGVDLTGMVTGASSSNFIAPTGVGRAATGALLAASPLSAITLPQVAASALMTSPRLVGRGAITTGQIARIINQLYTSPQGQQLLPQLLGASKGQE